MVIGDPRFGQFADPGFGASLTQRSGSPGVLPDTGAPAGQSASSDQNNGVINPRPGEGYFSPHTDDTGGSELSPGLMPHRGGGPVYLEDGGDPLDQDTGNDVNGSDATLDPMSILNWGRKAHGLPQQFFAGNIPTKPAGPGGDKPNDNPFPTQTPVIPFGKRTADAGGNDPDQDQDGTIYAAEGGLIPDGSDDPQTDQEGSDDADTYHPGQPSPGAGQPQPGAGQPQPGAGKPRPGAGQPTNPKAVMSYLTGQGAMPPEQAAALEQRVDPQGQMDPASRKVAALSSAGSPQAGFGLMQHYRQKFNAYAAFAQSAIRGAGGRPPNVAAAADALNKAYEHVPDGKNVNFQPVNGGMQVTVGGNKSQGAQHFAEGGVVDDSEPDVDYETANSQTPSGSSYDRAAQASEAQRGNPEDVGSAAKGVIDAFTPKRDTSNKLQNFVMSIPQLLGWAKKDGQFDSVMENGAETTLAAAQQSQPQQEPAQPQAQPQQPQGQPQPQGQQPSTNGGLDPGYQAGVEQDRNRLQAAFGRKPQQSQQPQKPQEVGAKIGAEAARNPEATLREILHNVDQMYPFVGQNTQRLAARNSALTEWMKNRTTVEAGQTKEQSAVERARIAAGSRTAVADTNAGARRYGADVGLQGRQVHEDAATGRNAATNTNRSQIAGNREDRLDSRLQQAEGGRNYRTNVGANPGMSNEEAMKRSQQATPRMPAGGPAAQPRAAQGATEGDGPAPATPPPAGMKYQVNTSGTKWRLVPAQ